MSTGQDDVHGALVRPYAVTRGRTRPRHHFAIEALVSTTDFGAQAGHRGTPEVQTIIDLCREVRSVAEIAAHLRVPLGVARVLVGDLTDEGLVRVHEPGYEDGQPDLMLLERVLSGLRRL